MRGSDRGQSEFFPYGSLEERVPPEHPLRPVRETADAALETLSEWFESLYADRE